MPLRALGGMDDAALAAHRERAAAFRATLDR